MGHFVAWSSTVRMLMGRTWTPRKSTQSLALQQPAEFAFRTLLRHAERLRELADLIAKAPLDAATDPYDYLSNQLIDSLPPRTRAAVDCLRFHSRGKRRRYR